MPSGPVEDEHGVSSRRHLGRDCVEMPLHGLGVAAGQDEARADGTYSRIINLPPTALRGDFRFVFEARDKSGLSSNIIEHIMTVIE